MFEFLNFLCVEVTGGVKMRTRDGVELYFEKKGNGPPCLFLHGGPGYWSKSFQHTAGEKLEQELEMVYLDQRGCGRSGYSTDQNYSLTRLVDDIEELREFLEVDTWILMGHSFGGILAVMYAERYPYRTSALILSNVTLDMKASFAHQIQKGREVLGLVKEDIPANDLLPAYHAVQSELLIRNEFFPLQFFTIADKRVLDEVDEEGPAGDPEFQRHIFTQEEFFRDFRPVTASLPMPTLILTGEHDHAIGPHHHRSFMFSNRRVASFPVGHHPYVECLESFGTVIHTFLSDYKGGT